MALENGRFIIENYHRDSVFSSFLPGISGIKGIPIWCYYVNRGQAVVSFGTENKDHSIMEFFPAHQSYQNVKTMGFRSFIKVDGKYYEPFAEDLHKTRMVVGMNDLEIEEINESLRIRTNIRYYTLPEEKLGGLVREITIRNLGAEDRKIELLDGMPAVIPYGINQKDLKETGQTMKAWMQVEDVEKKLPYYRVRISTVDSAEVSLVNRGNYYFSLGPDGELLPMIVDPAVVFSYDTSYQKPLGFLSGSLEKMLTQKQIAQNNVPSGFCAFHGELQGKSSIKITSVSGMAESKKLLCEFAETAQSQGYFSKKFEDNQGLTRNLTEVIASRTGNRLFDEYARQTYLDNLVRGGHPVKTGNKVIHVFSRKHGDIERDYNYFTLSPEYYSQGNGSFRDVNQNRRSDVRFHPFVKETNIKSFYNLVQIDGYNPLAVKANSYKLSLDERIRDFVSGEHVKKMDTFFEKEFSPGSLLRFMENENIELNVNQDIFIEEVFSKASEIQNADFGEGFWTDHFVYNMDQIEAYLSIYPEMAESLLFDDLTYTYYASSAKVRPRHIRYVETENGIRQYKSVDESHDQALKNQKLRTESGSGEVYTSSLMAKLLVLLANKFTSMDMDGRGIEMEAGKPGWYDALNGLPGIFGSSVAESCELLRMMRFLTEVMKTYDRKIRIPEELHELITGVNIVMQNYDSKEMTKFTVWDQLNNLKEEYREKVSAGIDGSEDLIHTGKFYIELDRWMNYLSEGIDEAVKENDGICPTYYYREVTDFKKKENHILPLAFERKTMPLFLEGPVKYLKLIEGIKGKREAAKKVRNSALYDEKLKMYKVNASLSDVTFEIGRAKAFTPGWLENESIWLHMEYKYLLELLKNDLHEEFHEDLKTMCIPFLDFKVYGRSLLENSSFIASSANPDEKIHGKGFVARLSGSTAEFLEIWQHMMFGKNCFENRNGELHLTFSPSIPEYLIPENLIIETTFLGTVETRYHLKKKEALIPGKYETSKIVVTDADGVEKSYKGTVDGEEAKKIREGSVRKIDVYIM